jgi:formylmethanofuran dehydrogenase subunit E
MTLQYEDTVEPEIAPCDDCGMLVDEGEVIRLDGDWLCESCGEAQMACTGQAPDA